MSPPRRGRGRALSAADMQTIADARPRSGRAHGAHVRRQQQGHQPERATPRTVSASGKWGWCARRRYEPRMVLAWRGQKGGRHQRRQRWRQRPGHGRRGQSGGVRMQRTVGALFQRRGVARGWSLVSSAAVGLHPLRPHRRADFNPRSAVLGAEGLRQRRRKRCHQDGQYGYPRCQQPGRAVKTHAPNSIFAVGGPPAARAGPRAPRIALAADRVAKCIRWRWPPCCMWCCRWPPVS